MKKIIAVLLSLVFVLSLAACGGGDKEPESFENALEEGKYYYEKGDYLTALEALGTIYAVDPLYKEAKPLMDEISTKYVAEILADVDGLVAQGSYIEAINLMKRARLTITTKELMAAYDKTFNAYVETVRKDIDAAVEERGFAGAEEAISEAFAELPDEKIVEDLLAEYRKKCSKFIGIDILPTVEPLDTVFEKAPVKDVKGKQFDEGCAISYDGSGSVVITFKLDRQYSMLYGTVALTEDTTGTINNASVSLSSGGGEVFSQNKITGSYANKEFSAKISSVDVLTIRIKNGGTVDAPIKPMLVGLYVM